MRIRRTEKGNSNKVIWRNKGRRRKSTTKIPLTGD
jgi:hypothetical protein